MPKGRRQIMKKRSQLHDLPRIPPSLVPRPIQRRLGTRQRSHHRDPRQSRLARHHRSRPHGSGGPTDAARPPGTLPNRLADLRSGSQPVPRPRRSAKAPDDSPDLPKLGLAGGQGKIEFLGKIYDRETLLSARADWKRAGKIVVFTNGCYDVLHPGHIRLLESARSLGDILILALNTDASVQRIKGPNRPLIAQDDRAELA